MRLIPQALRRGPWRTLPERDVLQSLVAATAACLVTGGLLWLGYLAWTWHIAANAPTKPRRGRSVLLFGKRLVRGEIDAEKIDADFCARIARAHDVLQSGAERIVLVGGASGVHGESEAAAALRELKRLGLPAGIEVLIDDASLDTLENLRNARCLLKDHALSTVVLVSSRYHLPRCTFLAQRLGFDYELCAAETTLALDVAHMRRIALEAAYILWIDVGMRAAKLFGQQRVLDELS